MWRPWMRREYGLNPRDLGRYTRRELEALIDDHTAMLKASREG